MKIKDEKGEEIEVFTAEETQQKIEEAKVEAAEKAVEEYKTNNPDKADEVNKLKADLDKAQKDLEAAEKNDDKDGQVARLRRERDEALTKVNTVVADISKKFDDFTKSQVRELEDTLLKDLSGGNAEVAKKIKLEFDRYNPSDTTKAGIQERMTIAAQLVTGTKPKPSFMDNISGAGAKGNNRNGNSPENKEPNANEKAIGKVLGITDADREAARKLKESRGN